MKFKLLSITLILMFMMSSAMGAELAQKVTDDKVTEIVQKDITPEYVSLQQEQKEFKKTEFKYSDKDSKVLTKTDIGIVTEKRLNGFKVSAENAGKGASDSHDVLLPVNEIPGISTTENGATVKIREEHYTTEGTLDGIRIIEAVIVDGYIMATDVKFSSVIYHGFTGTYQVTVNNLNLSTKQTIDFVVTDVDSVSVEIEGADSFGQIEEGNVSTLPSSPNVVAYYIFDGNSSDYSGNGNDGVDTNVTYGDDGSEFNGIDSVIVIPDNSSLDLHEHTIHITLNSSDTANFHTIIAKGGSFGSVNNYAVGIYNNKIYYDVHNSSSVRFAKSVNIPIGLETITCTYYSDTLHIYGNAELLGTAPVTGTLLNSSASLYIGSSSNDIFYDGLIEKIDIYNTGLSYTEVLQLHTTVNGTAARTLPNATWVPVVDGEADLPIGPDGNVSSIEVVDSTGTLTDADVTLDASFTEHTTLISESEANSILDISIYKEYVNNATSGFIEYTPATENFTNNLSMTSSDPNATAITHNQTITVTTGQHSGGDSFHYNFTLSTLESFSYTVNWISKTATKVVLEYNSSNPGVENDFYLWNMTASSLFEIKYSNGTVLQNATSDSNGLLKLNDVGGPLATYKLINGTYSIEKQADGFVNKIFTAVAGAFALAAGYFVNRWRR